MTVLPNLQQEIETLKAMVAKQQELLAIANKPQPIRMKVGEKGGLSLYGINNRFPVTLYRGQWERILAHKPAILAFIEANQALLATKD
jgi:hypothetical protein